MVRYFFIILFFSFFFNLNAQDLVVKKNTAYFEVGGSGLLYSVNYDRLLVIDEKMRFSLTAGTWYIPHIESISDFNYMIGTAVGVNTLFGKQKHFAEFGVNVAYMIMNDIDNSIYQLIYLPFRIGYRYQKDDGGLFLRASFMPIVPILQDADVAIFFPVSPHFSLGAGYSF